MARAHRHVEAGSYYHVTSRGNNKQPIYPDDTDRRTFLGLLARSSRRQGWVVIAYCLMTNHYHLVVYLPFGGLSVGIQLLNGGYACRVNRRYDRTGHLFQNRFAARQIESESHLLEACRYVALNPVRAGLCDSAERWPWSSYRACAGLELAEPFLAESALLSLFDSRPAAARRAYRAFVASGHGPVSDTVTEV